MVMVLLLILLAIICLLIIAPTSWGQTPPPALGDWTVTDDTVVTDQTIVLSGNLTVTSGGKLTLTDCELLLNLSTHGEYHLEVARDGEMALSGTTVDSADRQSRYNFTIFGRTTIGDSTIRRLDGTTAPTILTPTLGGLVIRGPDVRVHNTTVEASQGFAVAVRTAVFGSINPVIEDCVIRLNEGGLYCEGVAGSGGNPTVQDCTFDRNGIGGALIFGASPIFRGCTFAGTLFSPSLSGVAVLLMAEPLIEDCQFQWMLSAITVVAASPTIRKCSVTLCGVGLVVQTGSPKVSDSSFSTCPVPIVLNSTTAKLTSCSVSGVTTVGFAVSIDYGSPTITDLVIDISLIGGAVSIVNRSTATITGSYLNGTWTSDAVSVVDSRPTLRNCFIGHGQDGIELDSSRAVIEDCRIQENSGWGILAVHEAPSMSGNVFGTGGNANGEGRVLQLYSLKVGVEHEDGSPAQGANFTAVDALDIEVANSTTGAAGLAFEDVVPEYEITNRGDRVDYAPYLLSAELGDLQNRTDASFDRTDLEIWLVLRSNLPPVVTILSPTDGATYDVWEHRTGLLINGTAIDPDGDTVSHEWYLDGELLSAAEWSLRVDLELGEYVLELRASDDRGNSAAVNVTFTMIALTPESFFLRILSPEDGSTFGPGEEVTFDVQVHADEHPYYNYTSPPDVLWESSLDGELFRGDMATLSNLTYGVHVITATYIPMFPEYIPTPLSDSVTIEVLAPPPEAFANISSPADGEVFPFGASVLFSANGSTLTAWDPPPHRLIFRWSSDVDGALGEGQVLDWPLLSAGVHNITLELTTDPFIASDQATVSITVLSPTTNPPTARAPLMTLRLRVGEQVNFSALGSADPDGDELTYTWDLGDGNSSSGLEVTHVYQVAGEFVVVLTVSDGQFSDTATLDIEVEAAQGPPPDGNGDDDDDGSKSTREEFLGWLFIILLVAILVSLLYLAFRGERKE
jgi:PKD repeat protein